MSAAQRVERLSFGMDIRQEVRFSHPHPIQRRIPFFFLLPLRVIMSCKWVLAIGCEIRRSSSTHGNRPLPMSRGLRIYTCNRQRRNSHARPHLENHKRHHMFSFLYSVLVCHYRGDHPLCLLTFETSKSQDAYPFFRPSSWRFDCGFFRMLRKHPGANPDTQKRVAPANTR